ncbi:MAG: hypothetical protein OZ921_16610 [Sorangiineae bacterium]|nr:hypothetical protein [Sorangiineae bacterium]MEB2343287.1 hypothetical protein [Deltaproteobacteria bacterium]
MTLRVSAGLALLLGLGSVACGAESEGSPPAALAGAQVAFDVDFAPLEHPDDPAAAARAFYDFPWPSDLRLDAAGHPDFGGFPNPLGSATVAGVIEAASARKGFPTVAVGWFRFDAPLGARRVDDLLPADASSPVLLIDVDESSPERGKLYPTVAVTTAQDDKYVPENFLAVAAYPGVLLRGNRKYAFVIQRSLGDASGKKLGVPARLRALEAGRALPGPRGEAARDSFAPLWQTLKTVGIPTAEVAAATVFTTGDVVADTARTSDALVAKYSPQIEGLTLVDATTASTRFCALQGTLELPVFQKGEPLYDTEGHFELDAEGVPVEQGKVTIPVVLTLPKREMPAGGYPLVLYEHGSGGVSIQVVDRGRTPTPDGEPTPLEGPAYVVAEHGFAAASSALPVNPERVPGAGDLAYINFNNLGAFPYTFRQGVFEQRLYVKALESLTIAPAALGACTGPSLPAGQSSFRFDLEPLMLQGQSMGGMYTNMLGAVEPKVRAVAPTGAGGFWSQFIIKTHYVGNLGKLFAMVSGAGAIDIDFTYPALHALETAWEPADPMVYAARLARWPLEGAPARPIYATSAPGDEYFPVEIYDALALANGTQQAGELEWQSMQDTLALDGRDGLLPYPVKDNLLSADGSRVTAAAVQYAGDGIIDPHYIYAQLDQVKYQYGCFFRSYLDTGRATLPAPAPLGTPCPE